MQVLKVPIYARANIADYWILDISEHQAYIFRHPSNENYQSETVLSPNSSLAPPAFPEIEIPLSELFLP